VAVSLKSFISPFRGERCSFVVFVCLSRRMRNTRLTATFDRMWSVSHSAHSHIWTRNTRRIRNTRLTATFDLCFGGSNVDVNVAATFDSPKHTSGRMLWRSWLKTNEKDDTPLYIGSNTLPYSYLQVNIPIQWARGKPRAPGLRLKASAARLLRKSACRTLQLVHRCRCQGCFFLSDASHVCCFILADTTCVFFLSII